MRRLVVALAIAVAADAGADPLDTFGFGARAAGLAGAVTASATGIAAAHANPAGVALGDNGELMLGWGYGRMGLTIDGADAGVVDAHGADLGVKLAFKPFGVPFAVGAVLHLPDQWVARIQLIPATEPHFVLLDNDVHRIVATPVVALRPFRWLSLGFGLSVLVDAASRSIRFDVGVVGGEPVGQGGLDVLLPPRVAPSVGALIMPWDRVRLGLSYRGEVDLALRLGIVANVDIAGAVTGDAVIDLRSVNFFTPRRAAAALAVDVLPELTLAAELAWQDWSSFQGGSPDVKILIALGITPPLVDTLFPPDGFADTLSPRGSVEWRPRPDLALRAGYALEPSPVPAQTGLTSFADNERHVVGVGAGLKLRVAPQVLPHPVALDVGLQLHHLRDRLTIKDQDQFPGMAFSSGGNILRGSATLSVEL